MSPRDASAVVRQARARRSSPALIAGAVIGGITGEAVAIALVSLGAIAARLAGFLEVGLSEDREREREAAGAATAATPAPAAAPPSPPT